MTISLFASLFVLVAGSLITWLAIRNSQNGCFYQDTHWLLFCGVFVWGDGLIMGPLWVLSGLLFFWLSPVQIGQYVALLFAIRSGFEVVYWLTHQAAGKSYNPPLFRKVAWLDANQSAILYQLLTMSWFFLSLFALLLLSSN